MWIIVNQGFFVQVCKARVSISYSLHTHGTQNIVDNQLLIAHSLSAYLILPVLGLIYSLFLQMIIKNINLVIVQIKFF